MDDSARCHEGLVRGQLPSDLNLDVQRLSGFMPEVSAGSSGFERDLPGKSLAEKNNMFPGGSHWRGSFQEEQLTRTGMGSGKQGFISRLREKRGHEQDAQQELLPMNRSMRRIASARSSRETA